jgi:hypothetical protein
MKTEKPGEDDLIRTKDLAKKLGTTEDVVRTMTRRRVIHAIRAGKKLWLYHWPTVRRDLRLFGPNEE